MTIPLAVTLACGGAAPPDRPATTTDGSRPPVSALSPGAGERPSASASASAAPLPDEPALPGWKRSRVPKRYGPDDLWEYIDGAAEAVLAHGFQELVTAGYAGGSGGIEVTADLYTMTGVESAFGLYAQELDPTAKLLDIGAEAALRSTSLIFWAGPHVVKLTAFREGPGLASSLETLARAIAGRIGATGSRPAIFARFPTAGLVTHSFRVVPKDPLGQSYLPKGYSAQYEDGGREWTLVAIAFDQPAAAEAGMKAYEDFVGSSGEATKAFAGVGEAGFTGTDSFYGPVVAARAGSTMAVALGSPSPAAGRAALAAVLAAGGR